MNVTKDGFKDRQLHIEDYLQMVSAEQKEYAEVSAHQRITENNDIITDFQTDKLMEKILSNDNLNCKCQYKNVVFLSYKHVGKPTCLYDIFSYPQSYIASDPLVGTKVHLY